jgi:hypothetical protein
MPPEPERFEVQRPGGGTLVLVSKEEVEAWESLRDKYVKDYALVKANDLALLGAILSQHLIIFRAERRLTGMKAQVDHAGVPTGLYEFEEPSGADVAGAQKAITTAAKEIRELEQSLGIDKKTREAGGQHTVGDYIKNLKKAAHQMGVHITQRTMQYEAFVMELRWKMRLNKNGDDEDKQYHGISDEKILEWCEREVARLEQADKDYATQKGKLFVGAL